MLNRPVDLMRLVPVVDDAVLRVSPAGPADLRHLPVGTELQARVTAAFPGRVYQVVAGDRAYTVALPIDAKPGDELQLTIVGRETPRGPLLATQQPAAGGAAVTTLSPTARFITTLLNTQAPPLPHPPLAAAVRPSVPLIPGPPRDTSVVAAQLKNALATSGMFYESHQAQWVAGERSLAQLLQEPQARVAPLLPELAGFEAAGPETATSHGASAAATPTAARAEAPVHPALLPIVKEQLQTLSALQLAWHGPVWPGQDMHWEIAEEPARGGAADAPTAWRTRLRLKLSRLGNVSATLSLGAAGLAASLTTDTPATADAMAAGSTALRAALSKVGSRPASVTILSGAPR